MTLADFNISDLSILAGIVIGTQSIISIGDRLWGWKRSRNTASVTSGQQDQLTVQGAQGVQGGRGMQGRQGERGSDDGVIAAVIELTRNMDRLVMAMEADRKVKDERHLELIRMLEQTRCPFPECLQERERRKEPR